MVTIVGTWDLAWNTPIKEVELWQFVLAEYAVDAWYMSPVSGVAAGVPWLAEDAQIETRLTAERNAGRILVFVDESADAELAAFVHPAETCYVLGKTGFSPHVSFFERPDEPLVGEAVRSGRLGCHRHRAVAGRVLTAGPAPTPIVVFANAPPKPAEVASCSRERIHGRPFSRESRK